MNQGIPTHWMVCLQNGRWTGEHRSQVSIRVHPLTLGDLQSTGQLLLPLGPPVLEPRLDLDLRQVESLGQLHPLVDAQVLVMLELCLQLLQLLRTVGLSGLPVHSRFAGPLRRNWMVNWIRLVTWGDGSNEKERNTRKGVRR